MTQPTDGPLHFVHPGPLDQPTGGSIYDRRMVAELCRQGRVVTVHELAGRFPVADGPTRGAAAALLDGLSDGARVVIDGLALPAFAESLARHAGRLRLVALVHHPTADETGLDPSIRTQLAASERTLLGLVRRVIVPSAAMARRVADYAVPPDRIVAVPPGTDPVPRAAGTPGRETQLLCVASLTPRKGYETLIAALAACRDLDWRLTCAGPIDRDPATTARVRRAIEQGRLCERVRLAGAQHGEALAALYHAADVFVLASRYEGYGMAFAEAMARGLPVVASGAGAVAETVPAEAGVIVPVGDQRAFAAALRRMITDPAFRARKAAGAWRVGRALPVWPSAAGRFAAALGTA